MKVDVRNERPLFTERLAMERMGALRLRLHRVLRVAWLNYSHWAWHDTAVGPNRRWMIGARLWRIYRKTWP